MTQKPSIANLTDLVAGLPAQDRARFERIFRLVVAEGQTVPPEAMEGWIAKQFGSVDAVRRQQIVRVTNRVTLEGTLFNTLRARRPIEAPAPAGEALSTMGDQRDLDGMIRRQAEEGCGFCQPLTGTPADLFGRLRGQHAITASNVAKYDAWHGVIIFDEHHPLHFTAEQVADYLDLAQKWAKKAHRADPEACYPLFIWNCLWRSGASILHGHAQVVVGRGMHFARAEAWRQAALRYREIYSADYFTDLAAVYRALGLAMECGKATILPSLTPIKEKETQIVAPCLDGDLKAALYHTLHTFVERLGVRSFNLALYQPPFGPVEEEWGGFPFIVRLVDRGPLDSTTSDLGTMELFAESVVMADPFRVAEALRGPGD
ncbi:MAG: hypothetical protein JXM73_25480 [Anaerolineae bacterium]|nr:hypothetical protein [Anaerolineae bacterium]